MVSQKCYRSIAYSLYFTMACLLGHWGQSARAVDNSSLLAELTFDADSDVSADILRDGGVHGQAVRVDKAHRIPINDWTKHFNRPAGCLVMWVKPVGWDGADGLNHYFLVADNPANKQRLFIQQTSGAKARVGAFARRKDEHGGVSIDATMWREGQWHMLAVTWDHSNISVFIDGLSQSASSNDVPAWWAGNLDRVWLGGHVHGKSIGATLIDEVRIYAEALSPEKIRALYEHDVEKSSVLQHRMPAWKPFVNNIANSNYQVIPIASSKTRDPSQRVEQILDGNINTAWQSAPGHDDFPIWVELSWPAPVRIDAIHASESWRTPAQSYRIEVWEEGQWRSVVEVQDRQATGLIDHAIEPCWTTKIRLVITELQSTFTDAIYMLNELTVSGDAKRLYKPAQPSWQAHFIWADTPNDSEVTRYFAHEFSIDDVTEIKRVYLQAAGDDGYSAYLNDHLIGRGDINTKTFDVPTKQLRNGRNVLALQGQELSGYEGVIAELLLIDKNDRVRAISTDSAWFASLHQPTGWPQVDLQRGEWVPVKDLGRPPHSSLHTDVRYEALVPDDAFVLDQWGLSVNQIRPGESTVLTMSLHIDRQVKEDYTFVVRIGEDALAPLSDYTIIQYAISPEKPTSQWLVGETQSFVLDLYMPEWSPHGEAPISIEAVSSHRLSGVRIPPDSSAPTIDIKRFEHWQLRDATLPQVELVSSDNRTQIRVNDEIVPPIILGAPNYRTFVANGTYATFNYPIWRLWMRNDDFYAVPDDQWDAYMTELLASWDQRVMNVLRCDPDPYLLLAFSFRPRYEWTINHPGEATVLANGDKVRHSFASPLWLAQSKRAIRRIVEHVMQAPYRGHVIGFNFGVGEGPETYYWGHSVNKWDTPREELLVGDYNPHYMAHLRQWLRMRYNDDVAALRAAWKDPSVNFETAEPDIALLRKQDVFAFRDPIASRMSYDCWEHHADVMAEAVIELGKTFDEAGGGRYIKGLWGFYSAGDLIADTGSKPGKAHHVAFAELQSVLESSHIDFLAGIQSYINLGWDSATSMTNLTESVTAHGKLWITEFDTRPFYAVLNVNHHTWSEQETSAVLRRNVAAGVVNNWPIWFQGFSEGTSGRRSVPWQGHASQVPAMRAFRTLYEQMTKYPSPSDAEVAVFINNADVYAMDLIRIHDVLVNAQVNAWHVEIPKVAAGFDLYHLPDVSLSGMDRYKLYIFLNAYNVTEQQRQRIKELVRREGATVLWLYLPGYVDMETGLNSDGVSDLTGFEISLDHEERMPTMKVSDPSHPLVSALPVDYALTPKRYRWAPANRPYGIGPIPSIVDTNASVIGRYEHNRSPALAVKSISGENSIFLAMPYLDALFLRGVCRYAGVHLYTDQLAFIDASRHWLSVQTGPQPFTGTIQLKRPAALYDIYGQEKWTDGLVSEIDLDLPEHTVKLFFLGSVNQVDNVAQAFEASGTSFSW